MTEMPDSPQTEETDPLAALIWLSEAGADEAIADAPADRFAEAAAARAARQAAILQRPAGPAAGAAFAPAPTQRTRPAPGGFVPPPIPAMPAARSVQQPAQQRAGASAVPPQEAATAASKAAAAATTLAELKAAVENFDLCPLKAGAHSTVFADGNPEGGIMLIGEAPGRDEDRQGVPFVGRAGKLLDKMLAAIHLDRSRVYITNVMNWRPPGNREPTPAEAEIMHPFLCRHIELANPAIILTMGAVATRHVLGVQGSILRMRGTWMEYNLADRVVPLMPFLHPAYLLRQPGQKKLAWQDLLALEEKVHTLKLLEPLTKTE